MPEGVGYSEGERKAAEELMQLGSVSPDEFLEKLSGLGFRLEKSVDAPPDVPPDVPSDVPSDTPPEEPPMESKEGEPSEEESPADEEKGEGKPPIGLNIVMLRKKAAKKAMDKHDY